MLPRWAEIVNGFGEVSDALPGEDISTGRRIKQTISAEGDSLVVTTDQMPVGAVEGHRLYLPAVWEAGGFMVVDRAVLLHFQTPNRVDIKQNGEWMTAKTDQMVLRAPSNADAESLAEALPFLKLTEYPDPTDPKNLF